MFSVAAGGRIGVMLKKFYWFTLTRLTPVPLPVCVDLQRERHSVYTIVTAAILVVQCILSAMHFANNKW